MGRVYRTRNLGRLGVLFFLGAGLAVGCAGKSESSNGSSNDDGAGTSGTAGSSTGGSADGGTGGANGGTGAVSKGGCGPNGGSSAKGGGCAVGGTSGSATGASAGISSGGASGDAGSSGAGTSGGGGSSGIGGTAGIGGAAGEAGTSGAECTRPEDCRMVNDCCGCRAEPNDAPGDCSLPCVRDACGEMGIATTEVSCIMGRCVIARDCDRSRVACRSAPPDCADGTVPSVDGTCWGPCLPPTECQWVTDCADCGDAVCVEFQAQLSSFSCVLPASGCNAGDYCNCLGACAYCSEVPQGVTCVCPTC